MSEITIDLKDFVRRVAMKWKLLAVVMLVSCLVVTLLGGLQSFSAAQSAQAALEAQQAAGGPAEGQAWVEVPDVVWVSPVHIVLGLMLGAVIVIVFQFIKYMMASKLRVASDLDEAFHMPVLGILRLSFGGKGKQSKIDSMINKLFVGMPTLSNEQQSKMICTDIKLAAQKENLSNIYLTGAADDKYMDRLKAKFVDNLKDVVPQVQWGKSPVCNPESLENLVMADGVVLFEKIDGSKYCDIEKELEYCKRYNVPVIGCVVIE